MNSDPNRRNTPSDRLSEEEATYRIPAEDLVRY